MPSIALQQQWSSALEHQSGPIFADLKVAKAIKAQQKTSTITPATTTTADKFVIMPSSGVMTQQWASALVHESGPIFEDLKHKNAGKKEKKQPAAKATVAKSSKNFIAMPSAFNGAQSWATALVYESGPIFSAKAAKKANKQQLVEPTTVAKSTKAHIAMPSAFTGAQSWATSLVYESGPIFSDLKAAKALKKQNKKQQKPAPEGKNFIAMPSSFNGAQCWATTLVYASEKKTVSTPTTQTESTTSSPEITLTTVPQSEPSVSVIHIRPASIISVHTAADSAYASDIETAKGRTSKKTSRQTLNPFSGPAFPVLRI
ncbi:uncharacterized protein EV422DRAFT_519740 [Fimicolochytrium jonesii]|uniref:uncharacterized protein n=1 Tax=Fimicolochytrium jonesii TaxID=1396493 RepID=UPI0022FDEE94|nr:uncharacterized protein EV422DRAFT_519740 [Fimicolochytrium jonesii]KAI8824320.1 hypothetical protein EV422DRAFT_519740 [Fimicolochytrium jonesii]